MRYLFGFVGALALSLALMAGCSEAPPECKIDADCDDQNECTDDYCDSSLGTCYHRHGGDLCDDGDDNECMYGRCEDGVCTTQSHCPVDVCGYVYARQWLENGTPCESDGTPGVCLCGLCKDEPECWIDEECDDGNECTEDFCDLCAGSCDADSWYTECDPCGRNGIPGLCIDGVCEAEPECSTDEECDDSIACTEDFCDFCYGCQNLVNCSDRDPCTEDRCSQDTGECSYPVLPDGTDCGCLAWTWDCPCSGFECWFPAQCCARYGHCQDGECL